MSDDYIASLPWYDSEVKRQALNQLWHTAAQSLCDAGLKGVQKELTRNWSLADLWQSSNLILSQCCGPDLFTERGAGLSVAARPVFAELDCTPGYYYSYIVSRTVKLNSSARIAVNSLSSRSGYSALIEWMDANSIAVTAVVVSGSHHNSLLMLEQGMADLAAIDAHTVNQLGIKMNLPIIAKSAEAFAPPYVYHRNLDLYADLLVHDLLLQALTCAVEKNGRDIGITEIVISNRADYEDAYGNVTLSQPL